MQNIYEQLSIFADVKSNKKRPEFSKKTYEAFDEIRFIFRTQSNDIKDIYLKVNDIVPQEAISFNSLPLQKALICELLSSALCHQINWDFIRKCILDKSRSNPEWLSAEYLSKISTNEVNDLIGHYSKPDRIRIQERTKILNNIGKTYIDLPDGINSIFFSASKQPNSFEQIYFFLNLSHVFSSDPMEKKLYLLIAKISRYKGFESLGTSCKPTIDYHIIRSFIRRGFINPKTKHSKTYLSTDAIKKESTLASIRKHCSNIFYQISAVSKLNINQINLIEWWIGRSVCNEVLPDCLLKNEEAQWLKPIFSKCPFYDLCYYSKNSELSYNGTFNYKGQSY